MLSKSNSKKAKEWQESLSLKMTILCSKIRTNPIWFVSISFLILYVGSMFLMWMWGGKEFLGALFLTTSAAFGDIETGLEHEPSGRGSLIAIFCLILNVIFLGVVLAYLNDYVRQLSSEGGYIKKKVNYNDHIVICGWNYQGEHIIDALRSKDIHNKKQIVVLADHKKRPFKRADVVFVRGSPLEPNDLKRAGVDKAESVIILTDVPIEKSCNPDDNAFVISTLIRECPNKNAYISVQLLSSNNEEHLKIAGANTAVCLDNLGGSILAFSAEYHGILRIVKELLFTPKGSEIYRCKHDKYAGKNFTDIGKQLLDKKMILIAIETKDDDYVREVCSKDKDYIQKFTDPKSGDERALIVNPQGDYELREDDSLFVISEKKPTEEESTILKDHIVICGWNYQGNDIVRTLKGIHKKQIKVLADREKYEKNPIEKRADGVFVPGSPLELNDLKSAGVDKAESVIILTDIPSPIEKSCDPDNRAFVISALIRRDINKNAYISVQLLSSKNEEHLKIAGANTIVCLDKLGGSILAFSAEYHGTFKIINELLIISEGSEIYRCKQKIPDKYLCKNFREVGKQLLDKKMILIALETKDDDYVHDVCNKDNDYIQDFIDPKSGDKKVLIVNPQGDYELREADSLFIISESEPTEL